MGCATYDASGPVVSKETFTYSYGVLPSWLSASGSTISGTPPIGASGSWVVNVNYRGSSGTFGSNSVVLTTSSVAPTYGSNFFYYPGYTLSGYTPVRSTPGSWVLLFPVTSYTTVSTTSSPDCTAQDAANNNAKSNADDAFNALAAVSGGFGAAEGKYNDLRAKRDGIALRLVSGNDALSGQLTAANNEVNKIIAALDQAKLNSLNANTAVSAARGALDVARANRAAAAARKEQSASTFSSLTQQLASAKAKYSETLGSIDNAKRDASEAQRVVDSVSFKVSSAQSRVSSASDRVAKARAELQAAEAAETEARTELSRVSSDYDTAKAKLTAAQAVISNSQSLVENAQKDVDTVKNAVNSWSTVSDSDLTRADEELARAEAGVSAANSDAADAQSSISQLSAKLDAARSTVNNLLTQQDVANSRNAAVQAELSQANAALAAAEADLQATRDRISAAQARVNSAGTAAQLALTELSTCRGRRSSTTVFVTRPTYTTTVRPASSFTSSVVSTGTAFDSVIAGSGDCGSGVSVTRGSGVITSVGLDYLVVGGSPIYWSPCTTKVYRARKTRFYVADMVDYEFYVSGGRKWARRLAC